MDSPFTNLPPAVVRALQQLVHCVPPQRLQRTLRTLLLEYLSEHAHDAPPELEHVAEEFICLFRLMDALAEADTPAPLPRQ